MNIEQINIYAAIDRLVRLFINRFRSEWIVESCTALNLKLKKMLLILFILTICTLFYVYSKWNYGYWERNKVPGPKPTFIVGNVGSTLNFTKNIGQLMTEWYK